MKNKKGFTLVELLAVVVILGIITLISLPVVRNISVEAEKKQYAAYSDSLKNATKLYMDSYSKDIFGRKGTGCYPVTYEQLYEKGLIKDISLRDISCNSGSTYVLVFKTDDNFSYAPNLGCGKVVNGVISLPEGASLPDAACSVSATTIMNIQATPDKDESYSKSKNVTVTITSYTGISTQARIYYGISTDPNSDNPDGGWHPLPMDIKDKETQKKTLLNATPIVVTTKLNKLFEGLTGNYYLILKVEHLTNLDGDNWNDGSSNRVSFGAYKVDNEAPKWNDSAVVSSTEGYNAIIPKLDLKVTDVLTSTLTGEEATANSLRMCITYDNEEACPTTVKEIRKIDGSRYEVYNPTKTLKKIQDAYVTANASSHNHTIYVTVADRAGNYITKSFGYKVAYQVTYDKNTGTGTTNPTYCDEGVNCILRETGFTKAGYKFDGWFLATSGGDAVTSLTLTKDTTVYARWSSCGAGSYSNNNQCSTCPANTYSDRSANDSCTACPDGYSSAAGSGAKSSCIINCGDNTRVAAVDEKCTACPTDYIISAHTVTAGNTSAACIPATKQVTYDGNGETGGSTDATTCNYNKSCTLRSNGFTKTGYTFDGWYTAASGGTKYGTTTTITTDITVYAHWKDVTPPTLTAKKTNTGTQNGVTITITCSDAGSGCNQGTYTYNNQKSSQTFTIADKAGNNANITVSVSGYNCNGYACNHRQCNCYNCNEYNCNCRSCPYPCQKCYNQNSWGQAYCYDTTCTGTCCDKCHDRCCDTCSDTCYHTCYN